MLKCGWCMTGDHDNCRDTYGDKPYSCSCKCEVTDDLVAD